MSGQTMLVTITRSGTVTVQADVREIYVDTLPDGQGAIRCLVGDEMRCSSFSIRACDLVSVRLCDEDGEPL
ncbi:MAG: hypothetical protein AAGI44_03000 [Pseudomonadota bacterium]